MDDITSKKYNPNISRVSLNGTGNNFVTRVSDGEIPPAFKQNEFASSYESRIN